MSTVASAHAMDTAAKRLPGVGAFFAAELKQQMGSAGTWICFFLMIAMSFRFISDSYWNDLVGSGRVPVNAPVVIYYIFAFGTYWAAIFATSFMTAPIVRDLRYGVAPIVYAMPFRDVSYLAGKYLAGLATLLFVMSGLFVSFVLMSWLQPSLSADSTHTYMPMPWLQSIHAFAVLQVTACFFFGTVHFVLAALTGRMTPSYAFLILTTLVFLSFEVSFQGDTYAKVWPQIIDPVGYIALQGQVFYWTPDEQAKSFISLDGTMLLNRAIYVALGVVLLVALWFLVDLRGLLSRSDRVGRKSVGRRRETSLTHAARAATLSPLARTPRAGVGSSFRLGWTEFVACAQQAWFAGALLSGFVVAFAMSFRWGSLYQLPVGDLLPSAVDVLDQTIQMYVIVGLLAVVFGAGEIIARDRVTKSQMLVDATPASNWTLLAAKLVACALVVLVFTALPAAATLTVQLVKGYEDIEWPLYLYTYVFGLLPSFTTYALIATAIHVTVRQRAVAHVLAIVACLAPIMMYEIKVIEHPLLMIGHPSLVPLTGFDALGQFDLKLLHLDVYYVAVGATLLVLAFWLWPRGIEVSLPRRLRQAGSRVSLASVGALLATAAAAGITANSAYAVLDENNYADIWHSKAERARYELRYGRLAHAPTPKIATANLSVDLEASARRMKVDAELVLKNPHNEPIRTLEIGAKRDVVVGCVAMGERCIAPSAIDSEFNHASYALSPALSPGEERTVRIALSARYAGYSTTGFHGPLVADGSFVDLSSLIVIGYDETRELTLIGDRQFHKLPPRHSAPDAALAARATDLAISSQADTLPIEIALSTDEGQVAIAPGELVEQRQAGPRITRRYRIESGGLWDVPVASARYAVKNAVWSGASGERVEVQVHHLPRHVYNAARFADAARASLEYLAPLFGPYPYRTLRIVETPNELGEEPRASGNMIAIPETDGWLHDYRSLPVRRDWILYTVAGQVARVWWGGRVVPGELKGAVALSDGVPDYLALRIVERVNGIKAALDLIAMKRDVYLRARSKEDAFEPPVIAADEGAYHDEKAVLALVVVRNVIGAERLDQALAGYARRAAMRTAPPYANAAELLDVLVSHAETEEQQSAVRAAFTESALYDFRLREVRVETQGSGTRVRLTLEVAKSGATEGLVLPIAFEEGEGKAPHMLQAEVRAGLNMLVLDVPFRPRRVEIDPYGRFIDTNARDNARDLE